MFREVFQRHRTLSRLNELALGLGFAAVLGYPLSGKIVVCIYWLDRWGAPYSSSDRFLPAGFFVATLAIILAGAMWARTMRTRIRRGWLLSIPSSVIPVAILSGFVLLRAHLDDWATWSFHQSVLVLLAMWIFIGLPMLVALWLSKRGPLAEEKGEALLACVGVILSLAGLWTPLALLHGCCGVLPWFGVRSYMLQDEWTLARVIALLAILVAEALLALLLAATVLARSLARASAHRQFLQQVEGGLAPGYRIDVRNRQRVLVRMVTLGDGYRASEHPEDIAQLGIDMERATSRVADRRQDAGIP